MKEHVLGGYHDLEPIHDGHLESNNSSGEHTISGVWPEAGAVSGAGDFMSLEESDYAPPISVLEQEPDPAHEPIEEQPAPELASVKPESTPEPVISKPVEGSEALEPDQPDLGDVAAMLATAAAVQTILKPSTQKPKATASPSPVSKELPRPDEFPDSFYTGYRRKIPPAPLGFAKKGDAPTRASTRPGASPYDQVMSALVQDALSTLFGKPARNPVEQDPLQGKPNQQFARNLVYEEVRLIDDYLRKAPKNSDSSKVAKEVNRRKDLLLMVERAEKPKGAVGRNFKDLRRVARVYDFVQAERERRQAQGRPMNNERDITKLYASSRDEALRLLDSAEELSAEEKQQAEETLERSRIALMFQRSDGTYPFY